jgi:hypothetical protein
MGLRHDTVECTGDCLWDGTNDLKVGDRAFESHRSHKSPHLRFRLPKGLGDGEVFVQVISKEMACHCCVDFKDAGCFRVCANASKGDSCGDASKGDSCGGGDEYLRALRLLGESADIERRDPG